MRDPYLAHVLGIPVSSLEEHVSTRARVLDATAAIDGLVDDLAELISMATEMVEVAADRASRHRVAGIVGSPLAEALLDLAAAAQVAADLRSRIDADYAAVAERAAVAARSAA